MPKGIPNKRYTGEFKQMVIEDMRDNGLDYIETMRKYNINSHSILYRWERIYIQEGAKALFEERRGRVSSVSSTKKGRPPKLDKKVEEDLIAENQRLRMEIAYLKKLNALVHEQKQQKNKKLR
jgi:transposase-like protein